MAHNLHTPRDPQDWFSSLMSCCGRRRTVCTSTRPTCSPARTRCPCTATPPPVSACCCPRTSRGHSNERRPISEALKKRIVRSQYTLSLRSHSPHKHCDPPPFARIPAVARPPCRTARRCTPTGAGPCGAHNAQGSLAHVGARGLHPYEIACPPLTVAASSHSRPRAQIALARQSGETAPPVRRTGQEMYEYV